MLNEVKAIFTIHEIRKLLHKIITVTKIIALCSCHCCDVADNFLSVPCTFEDSDFICGYVTTELGRWRWSRESGKDNNPLTGPESDFRGNSFGSF